MPESVALRIALIVVVEALAVLVLFILAANVLIPLAAPPNLPTPTLPIGALRDCPRAVAGCR